MARPGRAPSLTVRSDSTSESDRTRAAAGPGRRAARRKPRPRLDPTQSLAVRLAKLTGRRTT
eukprot:116888-Hanusia_phi.AAC.1